MRKLTFGIGFVALLIVVLSVPSPALAQSEGPKPATAAQVYDWIQIGSWLLGVIGASVAMYFIGAARNKDESIAELKAALAATRNDLVGLNKFEATATTILQPAGLQLANLGLNWVFSLLAAAPIDAEVVARAKDIVNIATDGKPNLPPEPGTPNNPVVTVPATQAGPNVTAEIR